MGGIVWIASYPKSGNTWTRNFLHNLIKGDADINKMDRLTTWDSFDAWYRPFLPRPLAQCSKEEVAAVRHHANRRIAESTRDFVFVKTHNAMVADRGTTMITPSVTAGAIYIVRNPLDVVISYSHHLVKSVDDTIRFLNLRGMQSENRDKMAYEVQSSWWENVYSWTRKKNPSIHIMRYEDMVLKPLSTFRALLRFLRIDFSEEELQGAIDASSFEKLRQQEREKGFREKPEAAKSFFRAGKVGQWQNVLSKDQIASIISENRRQMARFGYLPYGY